MDGATAAAVRYCFGQRPVRFDMKSSLAILFVLLGCFCGSALAQRVEFRDDHTILTDGKPFFPIGLYYCYEEFEDESGKLLAELRDYGFNTAGYYRWGQPTWRKELERADKLGLKVWIRGINGLAVDSPATEAAIKEQLTQTKDSGALLFWEFQDEPLLNKVSVDQAAKGQELVRAVDPDHPLLTVEWPGSVERFDQWRGLGDIYATDLYPIPRDRGYGRHPNHDITQMRDYIAAINKARGDRPVALVLQAWNWEPLNYGKRGYPTPEESRCMAYQSVIHGAKALLYYGQLHCTRPNSASALWSEATDPAVREREFKQCQELNAWFWEKHRAFFQELKQAQKIFVLRNQKEKAIRLNSATPAIEMLVKQAGEEQYVLAVNASDQEVDVEFALPENKKLEKLHVHFENRTVPTDAGKFKDRFAAYDVHVYGTSAKLPE